MGINAPHPPPCLIVCVYERLLFLILVVCGNNHWACGNARLDGGTLWFSTKLNSINIGPGANSVITRKLFNNILIKIIKIWYKI